MAVIVRCPNPDCGKTYKLDETQLGRTAVCRSCGRKFSLSQAAGETVPAAEGTRGGRPAPAKPAEETPAELPGKLGRFEIRARLGAGGFGAVYRAYDPALDREVALKVPRAAVLEKPEAKARFLREPKAAARLRHPHIVPVFDVGSHEEHYYIASAYIEGSTLEEVIARERPDFRRAAEIVCDLAEALHYAHEMGVVHRDVKPSNVMIDAQGEAMLMDFGIAHVERSEEKLTQDGAVMGTPAYMAPEQASSTFGEVGPASDQYSLGVVLYELLCGPTPFSGPPSVLIFNTTHREPDRPGKKNPAVPRDLETICLKAMSKEPPRRYADCAALAADLRRWLADEPIFARRVGPAERFVRWCRRKPALAAMSGIAAVLVVVVAVAAIGYLKTSTVLDQEAAQRREAELAREAAETQKQKAEAERREAESKLQQAESALQEALAALHEAEAAFAEAKTEAERAEAERKLAEAKRLVAEAEKKQADAEWEETLTELEPAVGRPQPVPIKIEPEPPAPPENPPLSPTALVSRPTPIEGVQSWTIETRTQRGLVWPLTLSPDGRMFATAGSDGAIRIWAFPSGRLLSVLVGHAGLIHDLAWSPDGETLASGGSDSTVRLWEMQSPRLARTLEGHTEDVGAIAWSPDGKTLASGSLYGILRLWDPNSGKPREYVLRGHGFTRIRSLAWSPDGKLLAAGSDNDRASLRIVDAESGAMVRELEGRGCAAWSPDGKVVASTTFDETVLLYDAASGELRQTLKGFTQKPSGIAWSPDGSALAVPSGEQVRVWDARSRTVWKVGESGPRVAWSPKGSILACSSHASRKGDLRFVDLPSRQVRESSQGHRAHVTATAWSRGGRIIACGNSRGEIHLWDVVTKRLLRTLQANPRPVNSLDWSPDDRALAAGLGYGGMDKNLSNLYLWHMVPHTPYQMLRGHAAYVYCVAWSPNGEVLASGSLDKTVRLWDAKSVRQLAVLVGHVAPVESIVWSPDGRTLASTCRDLFDRTIRLWDVKTRRERQTLDNGESGVGLAWSPDGRVLASCSEQQSIRLWDPASGRALRTFDEHETPLHLAWSPVGGTLAATHRHDPFVTFWDTVSGSLLRSFPFNNNVNVMHVYQSYRTIAWSPDGSTLAIGAQDGTLWLWDVVAGYPHTVFAVLRGNRPLVVSSDGHYAGPPGVEAELVYVVQTDQGQQMLSPAEFVEKYGWKNDPHKVRLAGQQTASGGE